MIYNRYNKPPTIEVIAYTSAQAGVTYTNGISGLEPDALNLIAKAISNNNAITNNTAEVWVSGYDRHISIGDSINYSLNSDSYSHRIMGFNHYDLTDATAYGASTATSKAGILMQTVLCLNDKQRMMNRENGTPSDGWGNSDLRTWLNETVFGYYPSAVKNNIKQVNVLVAGSVGTSTVITTTDKVFVPAEIEVFGTSSKAIAGANEGVIYAWYKENSGVTNRIKKDTTGQAVQWWLRSPNSYIGVAGGRSLYCATTTSGGVSTSGSYATNGIVPCICF